MAGGAGGRNDASTNSHSEMTYAMVAILIAGLLALVWFQFRAPIIWFMFALDWIQLKFFDLLGHVIPPLGLSEGGKTALGIIEDTFRQRYDAWNFPLWQFLAINAGTGEKAKWVLSAAIAALGGLCVMRMKGDGYKNKHTMSSLLKFQAQHWRTLAVSAAFNPDKAPEVWNQSMRPTDWIKENGIGLKRVPGAATASAGLDEDACARAFHKQLGEPWRGLEPTTPIHVRCLCLIFALHYLNKEIVVGKEKVNAGLWLREEIAVCYATLKGANLKSRLEELTKPYVSDKKVNEVLEKRMKGYAYTNTALYELLLQARKRRGVLAAAEFLWLKGEDRSLWYVLNNCGRRAFLVEGGGAVAHHDAEKIGGQPLIEPHVAEAVNGVKDYLDSHGIDDIEAFFTVKDEL